MLHRHPEVASRDCQHCLIYQYKDNGEVELGRDGKPAKRLMNCGAEFLAPCRDPDRGCPKGTPENPKTLWSENEMCYEHYQECKAVNQWPDDPLVKRNAAAIKNMEEQIERSREVDFQMLVLKLVSAK